jgi:hypothetical protein
MQQPLETAKETHYRLAFQVVFQKALIGMIRSLDAIRTEEEHLQWIGAQRDRTRFLTAAIRRLERLMEGHYNDHALWSGTFYSGTRLNFTQRGLRASTGLLTLALAAPVDQWAEPYGARPDTETRRLLKAAKGQATGPLKAPLENETLATSLDAELLRNAVEWWRDQMDSVRPGRPPTPYDAAVRPAVTGLRDGLRTHLLDLARGVGSQLDEDDVKAGIIALGAQRLAYCAGRLTQD